MANSARECEMCEALLASRDDWMHLANIRSQEIGRLMARISELEGELKKAKGFENPTDQ